MQNSRKEEYKEICNSYKSIPLFSQYWWLDVLCGKDNWDVYIVKKGSEILATMPFFIKTEGENRIITKALLTQNNGIWFNYPKEVKYNSKISFEEKIINEIIDYIESLGLRKYEQQYHYTFTNWLPFYWRGYSEITRYTYVIEDTENIEAVIQNFSSGLRNKIKKAEKSLNIVDKFSKEDLYRVNKMSFDRQNVTMPYSFQTFCNLYDECVKRDCCKMLFAIDNSNRIHGISFLVWDDSSVYYLLGGADPELRGSQAQELLIYNSILLASKMKKKFDFEGSVKKNIERSFRKFGGVQKPYFRIFKEFV